MPLYAAPADANCGVTYRSRRSPSLRAQLALGFGSLAGLMAAALSFAFGSMLSHETRSSEGSTLRAVARNVATELSEDLRKNLRGVGVLAKSAAIWKDGLASPAVDAMIARIQAVNTDYSWIGVADSNGVVRAASGGLLVGADAHARPWFAPGSQRATVGDVHPAKMLANLLPPTRTGEPRRFVDFAAPIAPQGTRLGVLVIHGSWEWADSVAAKLLPEDAAARQVEVFIFDRKGEMIYAQGGRLPKFASAGQRLPGSAVFSGVATITWLDGTDYLTSAWRLPAVSGSDDLGWTIVAREPESIAGALAKRAERVALAIGAAAAAFAVALAWLLAARLSRPLANISRSAGLVADGLARSIPPQAGSREIEELSDSLGSMTERLVAAKRDLEERVRARTEDLVQANAELARLARLDPLTGLPNRRAFDERADMLVAAARRSREPLSVAIVDADHFKRVNDLHGHSAGDATLIAIAAALRASVREVDMVARIGGEEFALLLPGTDGPGAFVAAWKIVERLRGVEIPHVGRVTVSCGAAELDARSGTLAGALARADQALYRAKAAGRDQAKLDGEFALSR